MTTIYIEDNTFAAACYDMSTISELQDYATREFDEQEAAQWGLNESEWRDEMKLALDALTAETAETEE